MSNRHIKNNSRGFIALMSAVIISAIIMGILFTVNRTSFYARFDALDGEHKYRANSLAESCASRALLRLAEDYSYDPSDEVIATDEGSCSIASVLPHSPRTGSSSNLTINTEGSYKNTFSNFQAKVTVLNPAITSLVIPSPPNITINSWAETADSGP